MSTHKSNHEHVEIVWLRQHLESTIKPGRSSSHTNKRRVSPIQI